MITINLEAKSVAQKRLKTFLEQNASEALADKINNGVYIEKNGKRLLNKKTLADFIKYTTEQAQKKAEKGEIGAFYDDDEVFGLLIHYYEEDDIIGKLYNEDGSEYKEPTPVPAAISIPKTVAKPEPKPQISIFDMMVAKNTENDDNSSILPPQTQITENTAKSQEKQITPVICADKPQKQPSAFYQTYLKLIERYKGFLILLRLGDFYEAFKDHATTLASELDLTLTGRDCGLDERVPMVGIPYHAVDCYVNKLIERGYKVILAEDLDNAVEFKNIDAYEEPKEIEELSEEEMRQFDTYVDNDDEELPTISKILGNTEEPEDDEDETYEDLLDNESLQAFDKEALCIIADLFDDEITLA